jgi:hypothetical protein
MQNQRQRHERRLQGLKTVRTDYESLWRELADYICEPRLRINRRERTNKRTNRKIIDSTGTFAWRTMTSGLMTGVTSPSRPWFRLASKDADLNEFGPVRDKIGRDEVMMRQVFSGSNIYNALQVGYGDIGLFGQQCILLLEDDEQIIRAQHLLMGEFWLAQNHRGVVDTCYRRIDMTVEQMVQRFGKRVSSHVMNLYDQGNYDEWIDVMHAIEPRRERDVTKQDKRNKPFMSNYWEEGSDTGQLLEESGFDENPILAPRWDVVGSDPYGLAPGMDALPDVKMLQVMQLRKGEAIDKQVRPPMIGTPGMRNNPASLLPGSITYVDDPTGKGFRPAIDVRLSLADLGGDIRETQDRVNRAFFADLFLMMANSDRRQITAREIQERHEEKLLALGPVLERLQNELLRPLIDRTYAIMERRGMLVPAPQELEGEELLIDYISMLAQAQKAVATNSIERLMGYVGNLAGLKPESLDKMDFDASIDEYADMVGAPPSLIRSDDDVKADRDARAQAQQQQQQAEMMATMAPAANQGAQAARLLSEVDGGGGAGMDIARQLGIG